MFWGSKERDWDALSSFFGVSPSSFQCICFVGSLQLIAEAVVGSVGGFSSPAAGSSPTVRGCKAPHKEPRLGQQQKNQYEGGGFTNPPQRNEADRWGDGSKPAHGPENVN